MVPHQGPPSRGGAGSRLDVVGTVAENDSAAGWISVYGLVAPRQEAALCRVPYRDVLRAEHLGYDGYWHMVSP